MYSKTLIVLLFAVLFAAIIHNMEAYQLDDDDETHMNNLDENNELKDSYFIRRLQALIEATRARNDETENKDSSSSDLKINSRSSGNRRPGLLRLKKKD